MRRRWVGVVVKAEPTRALSVAAALVMAATFASFWEFERPGLGLAHGYFLAIILAALATGPRRGALLGLFATLLYAIGVYLNPHVPTTGLPTLATGIRGISYVAVGLVVGSYASRNRALAARLAKLMDELRLLAERDKLTGLPNTRAFEIAVSARLEAAQPFVLLVADLDGLERVNEANGYDDGNDHLRRVADKMTSTLPSTCDFARIGGDEFAVLLSCENANEASVLALRFERDLDAASARVTFGWAMFPEEGSTALALYRIADERLYARKVLRGERRGIFGSVPDVRVAEG